MTKKKIAKNIKSWADVLDSWASDSVLATDLGVSYATVRQWRHRARRSNRPIPPEYWRGLLEAAKARKFTHLTAEKLAELAEGAGH